MQLLSGGKLFYFGQQILLAENVVEGLGQYKFGPAYRYHLSLVTKTIIKVYIEVVVILFAFCKFTCVHFALFFSLIFFGKSPLFSTFALKIYFAQMFETINCFGQNTVLFCIDVVATRKILLIGV